MDLFFFGIMGLMVYLAIKVGSSSESRASRCLGNNPHQWGRWYVPYGRFLNCRKCEICGYEDRES